MWQWHENKRAENEIICINFHPQISPLIFSFTSHSTSSTLSHPHLYLYISLYLSPNTVSVAQPPSLNIHNTISLLPWKNSQLTHCLSLHCLPHVTRSQVSRDPIPLPPSLSLWAQHTELHAPLLPYSLYIVHVPLVTLCPLIVIVVIPSSLVYRFVMFICSVFERLSRSPTPSPSRYYNCLRVSTYIVVETLKYSSRSRWYVETPMVHILPPNQSGSPWVFPKSEITWHSLLPKSELSHDMRDVNYELQYWGGLTSPSDGIPIAIID